MFVRYYGDSYVNLDTVTDVEFEFHANGQISEMRIRCIDDHECGAKYGAEISVHDDDYRQAEKVRKWLKGQDL